MDFLKPLKSGIEQIIVLLFNGRCPIVIGFYLLRAHAHNMDLQCLEYECTTLSWCPKFWVECRKMRSFLWENGWAFAATKSWLRSILAANPLKQGKQTDLVNNNNSEAVSRVDVGSKQIHGCNAAQEVETDPENSTHSCWIEIQKRVGKKGRQ